MTGIDPTDRDVENAQPPAWLMFLRYTRLRVVRQTHFDNDLRRELAPELGKLSLRELVALQGVNPPGQVSVGEARFLGELVRRTAPEETIIEIGTLFGRSTEVLTLAKADQQPLISVDNYSWNPLGLSSRLHEYVTRRSLSDAIANHNVQLVNRDKHEFYDSYSGAAPGLVFCDADHSFEETIADIEWARSVGARVICGHDYGEDPRVTEAVDSLGGPAEIVERLFVV